MIDLSAYYFVGLVYEKCQKMLEVENWKDIFP